jgi:uncharacterized protein YrrD
MTAPPAAPERLVRGRELIGLPVVTMDGDDVAEVRDVVYDPGSAGELVGFTLNKRGFLSGRHPRNLAAVDVTSVGRDAVMIEDETALDADDRSDAIVQGSTDRNVLGSTVVLLTGGSPRVEGYVLAAQGDDRPSGSRSLFVPLPEQIAVSGDALVVPSAIANFVRDDLAGFGAAIADFRATHHPDPPDRGRAELGDGS